MEQGRRGEQWGKGKKRMKMGTRGKGKMRRPSLLVMWWAPLEYWQLNPSEYNADYSGIGNDLDPSTPGTTRMTVNVNDYVSSLGHCEVSNKVKYISFRPRLWIYCDIMMFFLEAYTYTCMHTSMYTCAHVRTHIHNECTHT